MIPRVKCVVCTSGGVGNVRGSFCPTPTKSNSSAVRDVTFIRPIATSWASWSSGSRKGALSKGQAIRALLLLNDVYDPPDMANRVEFL